MRGLQANWLKSVGVRKGDAVAIYLPLICELPGAPRPLIPLPGKHDNAQLSWGKLRRVAGCRKECVSNCWLRVLFDCHTPVAIQCVSKKASLKLR